MSQLHRFPPSLVPGICIAADFSNYAQQKYRLQFSLIRQSAQQPSCTLLSQGSGRPWGMFSWSLETWFWCFSSSQQTRLEQTICLTELQWGLFMQRKIQKSPASPLQIKDAAFVVCSQPFVDVFLTPKTGVPVFGCCCPSFSAFQYCNLTYKESWFI